MKISRFSIRRPVFTLASMFLVIILGLVSLLNIPLKLIPDINPPIGVVVVNYPGASPNEVVQKVTKPLEQSLSTLPGLKTMTSNSQESANLTLLQFNWTTSIDEIESEIQNRINQTSLPDDVEKPRFMKFDPSQFPIIQLSLSGEDKSQAKLQKLAESLQLELNKVDGVASVNLSGIKMDEIKVKLDQDLLQKHKLSQEDIVNVIQGNSVSLPGDTVLTDGKELTTRVISSLDSVETLNDLVVTVNPTNGEKVTLGEIADVNISPRDEDTITRTNQEPSVLLSVLQQSDANTAQVSQSFQDELNELLEEKEYTGIDSDILFDQGDYVQKAIGNMATTLLLGGAFAMIVLFFFLRNIKSPLIIGIAIPYSVIVTFVLMYFADFTLNIMTLGGLALGIGMLVDNAIVVIENIYRHLSMGKEPKQAAYEGTKEVGAAITASTFTTVAVFLPVIFITGIIGELFTEFALTITFSLIASLFVALTVVPMVASRILTAPRNNIEVKRRESRQMRALDRSIKWSLKNRAFILILTLVLLGASIFGLTTVGTEFIPKSDEGFFSINVDLENGTAITETEKVVTSIENVLKSEEDIHVYVSLIGSTQEESFRGTGSASTAEIYVNMVELDNRDRSIFEFVDDIKKDVEGAALSVNKTAEVSMNLQSTSGSTPNTLTFSVEDSNKKRLDESVDKIHHALSELEDVTELSTDLTDTIEEVQFRVDRNRALDEGLMPVQIAMVINNVTRGVNALQLTDADNEIFTVHVSYDTEITKNIEGLEGLLIKKADRSFVRLDEVADIEIGEGPSSIKRVNQQDAVEFSLSYATSTTLGEISEKVDEQISDLNLPDETNITFGGDRELLESTMDEMVLAFILAIVFIYIVMAAQFESLKYPFVIMFTVPLMVLGVAIGLITTRTPIGLTAIIGLIVLAGIVVNNAIVIVDYINQKKASGLKSYDAIVESVKDRIRPILMTASTTILALLPLALGIGEGSEINQPMGISVIGGLISSTFLTLFIIPIVYSLFDKQTRNLNKKYATPDGKIIPAYMLEDYMEDQDKENNDEPQRTESTREFEKKAMVELLESILKIVKDDDRQRK
jgi:HAE1 family hydrophobic/amphiphilic exporter-1